MLSLQNSLIDEVRLADKSIRMFPCFTFISNKIIHINNFIKTSNILKEGRLLNNHW